MVLKLKKTVKQLCAEAEKEIQTITPQEAIKLKDDPGVLLVDLRDIRELQRDGRVPGALHAPRGMLEFWIDPESPYYKDVFGSGKRFVFFCAGGLRSALATQAVQQMGLDSLMGVELVVAVENRFGTRLPVMALSDSPTLEKLAVWIIAQLRGEEASTDARHDETRAQIEMVASQHASDVPDAEIDRIAASLRADASGTTRRMIH